jgi:Spy/CpxP family protein refolding chaperone
MTKIVRYLALVGLAVFTAQVAGAQGYRGRMTPEQRAEADLKDMKEKLSLTDEQATKVEAILKDRAKQAAEDREKSGGDREAAMNLMREHGKKFDEQIDAVLTPEQLTKMKALRDDRRKRMRDRPAPPPQ